MDTVQTVWEDFLYYRTFTARAKERFYNGEPIRSLKFTPERKKLFSELVQWCQHKGVEPRLWVYHLHQKRKWTWPPKPQPGDLMSENMLKSFGDMWDTSFYQYRMAQTRKFKRLEAGEVYDPNKDISLTVEATKERYRRSNRVHQCLAEVATTSLGYHPKSSICQACAMASRCTHEVQALVPFDIVALRAGHITAEQAQAAVRYDRR